MGRFSSRFWLERSPSLYPYHYIRIIQLKYPYHSAQVRRSKSSHRPGGTGHERYALDSAAGSIRRRRGLSLPTASVSPLPASAEVSMPLAVGTFGRATFDGGLHDKVHLSRR